MESAIENAGLYPPATDQFGDVLASLKNRFRIEQTGHIDFHLEQFSIFKDYLDISVKESYAIKNKNNDSYMLFTECQSKHIGHHHDKAVTYTPYQTWALAYLKHDFGRVLIRRETLVDKIIELIHPVELDFAEDKAFSDTFYMLVSDRQKAITGADRNFRNVVMDIRLDDFVIEIVEHTLIIGNTHAISAEKATHLAEFVSRLCTTCD
ncbi:hypothetical protein DIU31_014025 [Mucilaginibacter rubeus]|uniref:Uncharacterized protein n=2 Tax=Mucilaginibacter TaxID=423349 RepID=A0AAE6JGH3_9SPHI|nr:hypothetical protein [Mucilaginibacter rubeus]QEM04575.1 hypothetical protein DIU31_014025 [Mucilaginibacter rubeus]QTE46327.1 hypothetical protein J3L19_13540 [Mucilaginibacter rubeus]QTE52924.1 hypothetical protein J3L21_13515 [Mucilaginibacter rubeus]QTE58010.1 hypothetical protein J3L23_05185 [Mucilaginibacter rubeus]QTE62528.1 hypothetical protein J3L22_28675 [Mucilaginibacter rubeus]